MLLTPSLPWTALPPSVRPAPTRALQLAESSGVCGDWSESKGPAPIVRGAQRGLRRGFAGGGDAPGLAAAPRATRAAAPTLPGQQPEVPARPRTMPVAVLLCALCCGLLAVSARAGYSEDRCSWRGRYGPQEGLWEGFCHLVLGASLPLGTEAAQTSTSCSTEWTQVLVAAGKGVSRLGEQGPPA